MLLMPFQILGVWFRAIVSIALIAGGIYLLKQWYDHREVVVDRPAVVEVNRDPELVNRDVPPQHERRVVGQTEDGRAIVAWEFGWNRETAYLLGGLGLLFWSFGGSFLYPTVLRRPGTDEPMSIRGTGEVRRIKRDDGTELYVELHGPADATPIVMTHGWGLDVDEWYYSSRLADKYRMIRWDLPGLGESKSPNTKDWSLEKLAGDLDAVISLAGDRRVILIGHSIGGMIALTYAKRFPDAIKQRVAGMMIVHSTFTNPCRTARWAPVYTAIQKPILEPLCWLMIGLAPLVWLLSWASYVNGSAHRSTSRTSFSGKETRGQLNFMTRYYLWAWPSVVARGFLGMFRYDATDALARITTPTLVVAADRDEMCVPEASKFMAGTMPHARLATIHDARHCGLFEKHQRFNALLDEFVTETAAPTVPADRSSMVK
jgi:pimeloyl-ACP methyl ester carboxylesterase